MSHVFQHNNFERPVSRQTLWRYRKQAKITQALARTMPSSRDQHNRSPHDAVAEVLTYNFLLHFYQDKYPDWTVHESNIQSLDQFQWLLTERIVLKS